MVKYTFLEEKEHVVVKLEGDLDIEGTEVVLEELLPNLVRFKEVNLDFEGVPFVDSSGIGLLINLVNTLGEKSIKVTISKVKKEIEEVFELLQLSEILGEGVFI